MRILGISGSLRADSHNTRLLRAAAAELSPAAELVLWQGLGELPIFDQDAEAGPPPQTVADLRAAIASADAVLIATPEYNNSLPGGLKNALDWASRPRGEAALEGKPVAVIGASTGAFGAVWAQADTRRILGRIGADVVDEELPVGRARDAFQDDGSLADDALRAQLSLILGRLAEKAGALELAA